MTPICLTPKPGLVSAVGGTEVSIAAFQSQPLEPPMTLLYWGEASGSLCSRRPSNSAHINMTAWEEKFLCLRLHKNLKGDDLGRVRNSLFLLDVFHIWGRLWLSPFHCATPLNLIMDEFGFPIAMSSVTIQNLVLPGHISSETYSLDQGLANVLNKGPDSKLQAPQAPHSLFQLLNSAGIAWKQSEMIWYYTWYEWKGKAVFQQNFIYSHWNYHFHVSQIIITPFIFFNHSKM